MVTASQKRTRLERCVVVLIFVQNFVLTNKVDAATYRAAPQPTAALLGQTVKLRCSFDDLQIEDVVNWFGPPDFQHISKGRNVHKRYTRYSVVDSNADFGEFNLEIRDVQLEDDGVYRCSTFSAGEAVDARLTVIVPPVEPPEIIPNRRSVAVGQSLHISCRSRGGLPPPKLTWNNGTVPVDDTFVQSRTLDNGEVIQDLTIPAVAKWDNGVNMSCKADQGFQNLVKPRVASLILDVKYSPTVYAVQTLWSVKEGTFTNLTCFVDSNPRTIVRWKKLDGPLPIKGRESNWSFLLTKVSRSDTGIYQCQADNGVGPADSATISLDVLYPPTIQKTFDEKVNVLFGKSDFSLECKAEGNPKPHIRWRRTNTNLYFNNPLSFSRSDYQTEGEYECVAESLGFSATVKRTVVDVIGRPAILGGPDTLRTSQGSSFTLLCEVNADPLPESITWSWRSINGQEVVLSRNTFSGLDLTRRTTDMGADGILVIDPVSTSNAGEYICTAQNMFGTDSRGFNVLVEGPPVFVIAVVTGVLVVSIFLTVVAGICIARKWGCVCCKMKTGDVHVPDDNKHPPLPKQTTVIMELEDFAGNIRPERPHWAEKDPYAINISYHHSAMQNPVHADTERRKIYSDENRPQRKQIHGSAYNRGAHHNPVIHSHVGNYRQTKEKRLPVQHDGWADAVDLF
ncbi:kin of IRRE-like protein 3 isoform X2 [Branchiostoma lanceolatum]|uniref:kin of IRRE-like protein 3 isoform X2 n=1 Tax=Branchiostoma lanceolatum TaxID=7740 RepID=UPI0034543C22